MLQLREHFHPVFVKGFTLSFYLVVKNWNSIVVVVLAWFFPSSLLNRNNEMQEKPNFIILECVYRWEFSSEL